MSRENIDYRATLEQLNRYFPDKELLTMEKSGEFIPYPAGFLEFLFSMRDQFGFPTK